MKTPMIWEKIKDYVGTLMSEKEFENLFQDFSIIYDIEKFMKR
jgi:hypothetical protein